MSGIPTVPVYSAKKRSHSLIFTAIIGRNLLWFLAALTTPQVLRCPLAVAQTPLALTSAPFEATSLPTVKAEVREVPLVLSVTDHKGKYVDGLTESDLTILDNNQQQKAITFFEHQTNLPLNVAIVIDMSSSVAYRFAAEQSTIKSFIHTIARPTDSVNVFAFNDRVQLVSRVNNNWKAISRRIKKLKPKGNTALYDAIVAAADSLQKGDTPSRRVIIIITDGEENNSAYTLGSSIAHALKAECAIYAVNVSTATEYDDDAKKGAQILKQLTDATGGNYFRTDAEGDLSGAFGKIRRELRSQYVLAYKPSDLATSAFHRIQVVAGRKLHVRCRSGYYVGEKTLSENRRDAASDQTLWQKQMSEFDKK
jgi:VWFA-related protein